MKPRIIIVEGAQGVGKTTITRLLREQLTYSVLMSLTGIKDKTEQGKDLIAKNHLAVLNMISGSEELNFILDRSYITETCYCRLGYTDYNFDKEFDSFSTFLNSLASKYDVHVLFLVASKESLDVRLKRDKPIHSKVTFDVQNSLNQQNQYMTLKSELKRICPKVNVVTINNDNVCPEDIVYDIIQGSV